MKSMITLSNLYLIDPYKKQSEMLNEFIRNYTAPSKSIVTFSFERLNYGTKKPITIDDFKRIQLNEIITKNNFSIPDKYGKQMPLKKIFTTVYKEQYLIDLIIHLYFHLLSPHIVIDLIHDFLIIKASGDTEIEFIVLESLEKFIVKNSDFMFSKSRISYEWNRRKSAQDIKSKIIGKVTPYDFTIHMIWQTLNSLRMLTSFDCSKLIYYAKEAMYSTNSYSTKTIDSIQENFMVNLESTFCWRYNTDDLEELCIYWSKYDEWRKVSAAFSNKALLN